MTLSVSLFQMFQTAPPRSQSAPPRELPSAPCKTLETRRGSTVTSRIREREAEFSRQVQVTCDVIYVRPFLSDKKQYAKRNLFIFVSNK